MSIPQGHHYLPQFYLRNFCKNNLLRIYDRELNQYRNQTPKHLALINDYYTIEGPQGEKNTEIEKYFSLLESKTKPILDKIDNDTVLVEEEKEILATFIAFLKTRVPDFEKTINEFTEKSADKINKLLFSSKASAAAFLKDYEEKTGEKLNVSPDGLVEFVQSGEYSLEQKNRGYTLSMMLDVAKRGIKFFLNMDWLFLQAPSKTSFITSDNPFTLIPPTNHNHFYGVGILTPGAKKIIPLTQKTCLVMFDYGQRVGRSEATQNTVRTINLSIASQCDRMIIARDEPLLRRVVKLTNIDKWKKESRVSIS
jgi:ATP-dependent exoDNAse (exonuclease V) alpha subunit